MTEMAKGSVTHQRLIALLSQEGADFRVVTHEAVGKCEAVSEIRGTALGQGAQAKIIAERMRKNVELLTGFSNRYDVPEQMTISIGTVFSTGDTRNISLVMTEADKALREAKSEGGNKVIIHHI
jgi:GGDEF domain-containing protein